MKQQSIPLGLTLVTFGGLCFCLYLAIVVLNVFPSREKVALQLRWQDILVGLTIYLKTSIDFAIFIGNLMRANPGWKNRIAIEIGTAVGNAAGTIAILFIWNFFREIPLLMAGMIFLASLVLLRMAEESFQEIEHTAATMPHFLRSQLLFIKKILHISNRVFSPFLRFLSPNASLTNMTRISWGRLILFSASIPFILGLDDFAGYIPLFNVVNVFGFSVGVFLGHMLLNIALFLSPNRTVQAVRHPWILIIGGAAFVGIAGWGIFEVFHILAAQFLLR